MGSETRPSYVGLGHEMVHIQTVWNAIVDSSIWVTTGSIVMPNSENMLLIEKID